MSATILLLIVICLVFVFIGSSLWIGISLGITGALSILLFTHYPVGQIIARVAFSVNNSFILTALPFFMLMGQILFYSGISHRLYSGITPWVARVPGGLLHSNILTCTVFAAIAGSSSVSTATIGAVAIPELKDRGYDSGLALGSLAGAGTLGLLIPPSIAMIIYGSAVGESVGQLFAAGIFPGLMISGFFTLYIVIVALRRPSIMPPAAKVYSWKEKMIGMVGMIPTLGVILAVLGLIYAGVTTPTEAGAIGVFCALGVSLLYRTLSLRMLKDALWETIRLTCMIMLVVTGASILGSAVAYLNIPTELARLVAASHLSPYMFLIPIFLIYLGLGCFFDGISIMVLTLPIIYPLMIAMGFNGIWFGVVLIILIEAAQITPPVGFNLYILEKISGYPIDMIVRNSIPFFLLMLLAIGILVVFPDIALWLPRMMITPAS